MVKLSTLCTDLTIAKYKQKTNLESNCQSILRVIFDLILQEPEPCCPEKYPIATLDQQTRDLELINISEESMDAVEETSEEAEPDIPQKVLAMMDDEELDEALLDSEDWSNTSWVDGTTILNDAKEPPQKTLKALQAILQVAVELPGYVGKLELEHI